MNTDNEKEEKLTLELLNAVDQQSDLSQRNLAKQMGVALGLANSYMKRCARKGLVKVSEAPANRYLYYLTPKGFAEKARLTGLYLANSLAFYRQASDSCSAVFDYCQENNIQNVLLCGLSDLAEIALIRAMEANIEIIGVYDPGETKKEFFSKRVFTDLADAPQFEVLVLTDLISPFDTYKSLLKKADAAKILVPDILGIVQSEKVMTE